jgi:ubiquinone/menaquinone biosynthesis C-methylase UbiE
MKNKKYHDLKREKYWNKDYASYWMGRVNEANDSINKSSNVIKGDSLTTSDQTYINAINLLKITKKDILLEIGCGFGRSLSFLSNCAKHVTAVDISKEMINIARESNDEKNISYHVSPSEDLPFKDQVYDIVICFASFDAMYQKEALIEMNRILKLGGKVLITGKNDNYKNDDVEAYNAEVGARKKNHPNYFTDVLKLTKNIKNFGFKINIQKFYQYRGDFSSNKVKNIIPKFFYEFLLIIQKTSETQVRINDEISSAFSRTFLRKKD